MNITKIFDITYIRCERKRIQCKDHDIGTYKANKIYLSRYDDNTKNA